MIKKYQVLIKEENERKRVEELKQYLDEKVAEHKCFLEEQLERKSQSCVIKFGTSITKVLTSEHVLGRLSLYNEWKKTKVLLKKDLMEKMVTKFGFQKNDLQTKKVPELKDMAEKYLLERESKLVQMWQKELNDVIVPVPLAITNFFDQPPSSSEKEEIIEETNEDNQWDDLEKEILHFLQETQEDSGATEEEDGVGMLTTLYGELLSSV